MTTIEQQVSTGYTHASHDHKTLYAEGDNLIRLIQKKNQAYAEKTYCKNKKLPYWEPKTKQYSPPTNIPNVVCIRVSVENIPLNRMPVVIGADGQCFKAITERSSAHYIWWNKAEKQIEVWGFFERATEAVMRVNNRLDMVRNLAEEEVASGHKTMADATAAVIAKNKEPEPETLTFGDFPPIVVVLPGLDTLSIN